MVLSGSVYQFLQTLNLWNLQKRPPGHSLWEVGMSLNTDAA